MKKAFAIGIMMLCQFAIRAPLLANENNAVVESGTNSAEIDQQELDSAMAALRDGKLDETVAHSENIILRFEKRKAANTGYVCTNGQSDTLEALIGAASASFKEKPGDNLPPRTVAISHRICSAYFLKGFALIDLKRNQDALPFLEKAVEMDADNQHYLNELAEWHKTNRDWRKSLEIFTIASVTTDFAIATMKDATQRKALLDRRRCRSFRGIAFNHVELSEWEQARAAARKCLALIPDDKKSLDELAYIKERTGE